MNRPAADRFPPGRSGPDRSLLGGVLCGGKSSRMGRDKSQLVLPGGATLLRHAVDRLSAASIVGDVGRVVIIGGRHRLPGIMTLADPVQHAGPAFGVLGALQIARRDGFTGLLVTPVDLPDLTAADLHQLIATWHRHPGDITCGVAQQADEDRPEPLVAIYPANDVTISTIDRVITHDGGSLSRMLRRSSPRLVAMSTTSLRNVNTPQDWSAHDDGVRPSHPDRSAASQTARKSPRP